jgi:hypothetical protein
MLGRLLIEQVARTPAGGELTAGFFADGSRPRLLIVCSAGAGGGSFASSAQVPGWTVKRSAHGAQTLIEVHPHPDPEPSMTSP